MAGKNLKKSYAAIDKTKLYKVAEAVALLKSLSTTKFDETLELSLNLNVDPRKADQNVRGMVSLPNGNGKTVRIAVFAQDQAAEDAKKAGADIVGAKDLMEAIQKGDINFDRCIATPDMMALVGRVGKILGPKGLMPNPKLGTVTTDVVTAIASAKAGQVEFRPEKNGIVHGGVGRVSMTEPHLVENVSAYVKAILKVKPTGVKGLYVKAIHMSTTMGPGLKIDLADFS